MSGGQLGRSINMYLMNGTSQGRWEARLSEWNGVLYKIPHAMLKECLDDEAVRDLRAPGVYFLFGTDDESGGRFVYVGEADDVTWRLLQPHTFERDGSYWTEAVVYVTPDGTLEKGRVKYLENRFYTIARDAGRYAVRNGNTPKQSPVRRDVRDALEYAIRDVMLVMPALGHDVFEPLPSAEQDAGGDGGLLYFSRRGGAGGDATGRLASDGFWVLKGSYACPEVKGYARSAIKARERYGSLIGADGRLTEDVRFGSPSVAASFISGQNINGRKDWHDRNGVSLADLDGSEAAPGGTAPEAATGGVRRAKPDKPAFRPEPAPTAPPIRPDAPPAANGDEDGGGAMPDAGSLVERLTLLHLASRKTHAEATWDGRGDAVVVREGSGFCDREVRSCPDNIHALRKQLVNQGQVRDGLFTQDVRFDTASAAAGTILGSSVSGNRTWLDPDGTPLGQLKAANPTTGTGE